MNRRASEILRIVEMLHDSNDRLAVAEGSEDRDDLLLGGLPKDALSVAYRSALHEERVHLEMHLTAAEEALELTKSEQAKLEAEAAAARALVVAARRREAKCRG